MTIPYFSTPTGYTATGTKKSVTDAGMYKGYKRNKNIECNIKPVIIVPLS